MDLEYVLCWMVGASALFGMAHTYWQLRVLVPGWLIVYTALLAFVVTGSLLGWELTGYVAISLWGIFVLAPQLAARRMLRALGQHDLGRAVRWAKLAGALHPLDGQREQAHHLLYHNFII